MNWFKKLFTEVDNVTPDWSKCIASGTTFVALCLQCFDVIANHAKFDMQAFGIGTGSLFMGFAALLKFKKESNVAFVQPGPDVQVNVEK